jgi:hypothetical protein
MATASACPQVVEETIIQMFGGFLVSILQQQLSEELLLVINPKSVSLLCRNLTAEAIN